MKRLIVLAALAIAACATTEPPEVKVQRLVGDWRNQCIAAGYTSPEMQESCINVMSQAYANEQYAQQQRSAAMGAMGLAILQQSQPQPQVRRGFTCSTMGAFTNCY